MTHLYDIDLKYAFVDMLDLSDAKEALDNINRDVYFTFCICPYPVKFYKVSIGSVCYSTESSFNENKTQNIVS